MDAVFCWRGSSSNWEKVGGPLGQGASADGHFFASTPDRTSVWKYSGSGDAWSEVKGSFNDLIEGGNHIFGVDSNGNIHVHKDGNWNQIGSPGAQFVGSGDSLFALTPTKDAVFHWKDGNWTKIGGSSYKQLIAGEGKLFAITQNEEDIHEWKGDENWVRIGGPGRSFVVHNGGVWALGPNGICSFMFENSSNFSRH